MRSENDGILSNGIIGTAAPTIGVLTSMQEQIAFYLQITSLVLGIAVGAISLIRLLRK